MGAAPKLCEVRRLEKGQEPIGIRNVAKAIVIDDGKILLNRCVGAGSEEYYVLPGGGQVQYETMEEAVARECFEETGYSVVPLRLAAIYEEITEAAEVRERWPDYAHQIYHVFVCQLRDTVPSAPAGRDQQQVSCEWVAVDPITSLDLRPATIRDSIPSIFGGGSPLYLGSARVSNGPHRSREVDE